MEICSKITKNLESSPKETADIDEQVLKSLASHPPIIIKNSTGEHIFKFARCSENGGEVYKCTCGCNEERVFGGSARKKEFTAYRNR